MKKENSMTKRERERTRATVGERIARRLYEECHIEKVLSRERAEAMIDAAVKRKEKKARVGERLYLCDKLADMGHTAIVRQLLAKCDRI